MEDTRCEMPKCLYPLGPDQFESGDGDWSLARDHIVPKVEGGTGKDNFRPAHRLCNRIDYSRRIGRPHQRDLARVEETRNRLNVEADRSEGA